MVTSAPLVNLRPYQISCIDACTNAIKSGSNRIGVSLPTGAGKTTVFIFLLSKIRAPSPQTSRSLIIVNSVELAQQAAEQAKALFPHWDVEIEQGVKYRASGIADVTVATYQTLLQPHRLAKFDPHNIKAIIIDEAHHAAAPSYRRILSHFNPAIKNPDSTFKPPVLPHSVAILGFSATFSRHDGLALGSVFERIVYHRDFLEMIKEQWLCNVRFTTVRTNIDLRDVTVNRRTGDFNAASLCNFINTPTVNNIVVQTYLDRAQGRNTTLVFCVNLAHVRELTSTFRSYGIDARYLYSGTPTAERAALIQSFREGEFPVLVNCAILTEGTNIPSIDCVIVARPTRSRNVFAQMIGRGMRQCPDTGKVDCRIIDFVDSTSRVAGVVSTPTLFGLDPAEIVDDETTESLEARTSIPSSLATSSSDSPPQLSSGDEIPDPTSVTYTDYDDPFSLVAQSCGAPWINKMSANAWVGCGAGVYVLECMGKGFIKVMRVEGDESDPEHYKATYTESIPIQTAMALKLSPYLRSRTILTAQDLSGAIRGCDTYAVQKVIRGPLALGLLRSAQWRRAPASDSQKLFIQKRWTKKSRIANDDLATTLDSDSVKRIDGLTKGEAANIITRLKHGAQARYEKRAKAGERMAKAQDKELKRKAREVTQVGPLTELLS
ncbi:hypothetical protein SERLA73DRAFT_101266 [Serpula lacrymans var. lacrymans S7.3]|uniref:P-loop containing nucleoside triphosphate hydrolase protein n=2 Tax=Serpula lacrymans var. lacrymans TaxID=341189 RepID=F8PIH7_SERL3|nr:uncharacterized protein SERLADRAFT_444856 [Serpula lacrymans var. lacrymans S7.9]EGO03145.1 hypothetical protein SERLA73DRAFT_101266 [Serpula lacrymans var. lacrymans S7.3]EGO28930.1 hypothetical protein SERLADRAFT_444856 [Serpula lacrymans var. lacrymans S7.9]